MLAWPSAVGCCFLFFFFKLIWFQSSRTNVWNTEFIFICLHYTFGRTQPSEFRGKKWGRFHLLSCLEAKRQLAALQFVCFATILLFCCSVMSDCLWPHGPQQARLSCPSPTPRACSNSCPSSRWCHPAISSSVIPFSSRLQSLPASGSFPISCLFISSGQSIGLSSSASVLPVNIQGWFPLGWSGLMSLQSKGLPRVFSSTAIWK